MLDKLLTEQPNPASANIDEQTAEQILRIMNAEDAKVAAAVEAEIPNIARAVDAIAAAMRKGGRLFYIGAGTSGRLGVLDASECPPTFSVPADLVQGIIAGGPDALVRSSETCEDDAAAGARDLRERGFSPRDVACGIAASGRTPYVLGAMAAARGMGAVTVGISCVPDSLLSAAVDIAIQPAPGPEVIAGSTRMKAGTATKLVLNMLSTASMIRMGYVFGNLMVNVQATNYKLTERALRIVAHSTGTGAERTAELFEAAGRDVRTAIVMGRLNIDCDEARRRLQAAGGVVSRALKQDRSWTDS